jgi:hypothetical protein
MDSPLYSRLNLIHLALAAGALTAVTGCSNSGSPVITGPTAAKNMYVVQYAQTNSVQTDSILTFPTSTTGTTATPTATLNLPSNFDVYSLATGPTGELYVGGYDENADFGKIFIYPAGSTGSATPSATLIGGGTGTFTYPDYLAVNSKGQLFVFSDDYTIESFAAGATSAASPAQYLTWGTTNLEDVYGLATDTAGQAFVVDYDASLLYGFAAGATGSTAPATTISGTDSGNFNGIWTLASDPAGNLAVVNYNDNSNPTVRSLHTGPLNRARHAASQAHRALHPRTPVNYLPMSIIVFSAGANGTPAPLRTIVGASTGIADPYSLAMDAVDNLYYVDYSGSSPAILTFPSTATGNVAPTVTFTSTAFTDTDYEQIAVF